MSDARLLVFAVLLAGCDNAPGQLTVSNHYTGTCAISVRFVEGSNDFTPIDAGATTNQVITPGVSLLGFKADGSMCGGMCRFKDSQNFNLASCEVYAAGAEVPGTVEIVDDATLLACPSGPVPQPTLRCSGP